MAGEEYAVVSPTDLLNFNQQVQATNPWNLASQGIASWQPNTSTWSGTETGLASFGKSFLAGVLGNYAREDAARQMNAVAASIPSLLADPLHTATPEGVSEAPYAALRASAGAKIGLADQIAAVLGKQERAKAKGQLLGQLDAKKEASGGGPLPIDPESPFEKKVVDLRTAFDKRDTVQNFTYINRLSNQLDEIIKNPSAVADSSLAKIAVQFIEPKLSVNAGEGQALAQSASIPEEWKASINKSLRGGTGLPPEVRAGLLDLARAAKVAHGKAYQQDYNLYNSEADRFGIPMNRITNIAPLDLGRLQIGGASAAVNQPFKASDLLAKGYTKGPNGWIAPGTPHG